MIEILGVISIITFVVLLHLLIALFWQKLRTVAKVLLLMVIVAYWLNVLTTLGEWRIGKKVLDTNTENHIRYRMMTDDAPSIYLMKGQ